MVLSASPPLALQPALAIPRLIWTFWSTPLLPEFVAACLSTLEEQNPAWTIHLIRPNDTQFEQPPAGMSLTPAQLADWYRLSAASKFGGVWVDASVIALQGLESWVNLDNAVLQGWSLETTQVNDRSMSSWAFATPPAFPFVIRWRENFKHALTVGTDKYVASLPVSVTGRCLQNDSYLAVVVAWRQTEWQLRPKIQYGTSPKDADPGATVRLMGSFKVTGGIRGPFWCAVSPALSLCCRHHVLIPVHTRACAHTESLCAGISDFAPRPHLHLPFTIAWQVSKVVCSAWS